MKEQVKMNSLKKAYLESKELKESYVLEAVQSKVTIYDSLLENTDILKEVAGKIDHMMKMVTLAQGIAPELKKWIFECVGSLSTGISLKNPVMIKEAITSLSAISQFFTNKQMSYLLEDMGLGKINKPLKEVLVSDDGKRNMSKEAINRIYNSTVACMITESTLPDAVVNDITNLTGKQLRSFYSNMPRIEMMVTESEFNQITKKTLLEAGIIQKAASAIKGAAEAVGVGQETQEERQSKLDQLISIMNQIAAIAKKLESTGFTGTLAGVKKFQAQLHTAVLDNKILANLALQTTYVSGMFDALRQWEKLKQVAKPQIDDIVKAAESNTKNNEAEKAFTNIMLRFINTDAMQKASKLKNAKGTWSNFKTLLSNMKTNFPVGLTPQVLINDMIAVLKSNVKPKEEKKEETSGTPSPAPLTESRQYATSIDVPLNFIMEDLETLDNAMKSLIAAGIPQDPATVRSPASSTGATQATDAKDSTASAGSTATGAPAGTATGEVTDGEEPPDVLQVHKEFNALITKIGSIKEPTAKQALKNQLINQIKNIK